MPGLTVYGRADCHLCEQMLEALAWLREEPEVEFDVTFVDVDRDPALARRYGLRVPVLAVAGRELCDLELDLPAVRGYLSSR